MSLCERCQRELLQLDYPPEIDVGTRVMRLSDGSTRRLESLTFEMVGILWPRREAGYLHRDRLHQLFYGTRERADNSLRMAIHYARLGLRGSAYEIQNNRQAGYRIAERGTLR